MRPAVFLDARGFYFFLFHQSRLANSHDRDRIGKKVKGGAFGCRREKTPPFLVRVFLGYAVGDYS